jgi:hypothetical protein
LKISLDRANALWLPAERARGMQISVVIELDERLERDPEAFAIVEDGAMMIGNPPRPRIEIKPCLEFAGLLLTAELDKGVTAAQRPLRPPAR